MPAAIRLVETPAAAFAEDVRAGLSKPQKELPCEYFYDDLGSALFEAITLLPEYGLTRADQRLVKRLAPKLPASYSVVAELGSGSGTKTRWILEALRPSAYFPIDISAAALARCQAELAPFAAVRPICSRYLDGLREVVQCRPRGTRLLLLFLGSTIGNFDVARRDEFLAEVRSLLSDGDGLLIGFDLVKPADVMIAAYDDPGGITAAFNLNLLARINRELGANFQLRNFAHEARYLAHHQRIEMHLRSRVDQCVEVPGAGVTCMLRRGETIWTESSHKVHLDQIPDIAGAFVFQRVWVDPEWPFAECLWTVDSAVLPA